MKMWCNIDQSSLLVSHIAGLCLQKYHSPKEMRLWQRAAGVLKDKKCIWVAKFSRRTAYRIPDLEVVIIRATSHDESHIDCKNMQRVFQWVRTSPLYLKPLIWAISKRMQKTRSWVVALKGLILMHGVFCCEIPTVQRIERLPFDLSNFSDSHLNPEKMWDFNAFIRGYFAYLDKKSAFISLEVRKTSKQAKETQKTLMEELEKLQKLQGLIDMLLQIKPQRNLDMNSRLILEAMDCVIVEVFDLYGKFCKGIAGVLLRIGEIGGRMEAAIGLNILKKAATQSDDLTLYFEFCKEIGVLKASQCPKFEKIAEEDIQDLERIINNGVSQKKMLDQEKEKENSRDDNTAITTFSDHKIISEKLGLKTVITNKWVVFEEESWIDNHRNINNYNWRRDQISGTNPFEESYCSLMIPYRPSYNQVLPDLISF